MLQLFSESGSFTSAEGFVCRFTNENIGLRLRMGGVELCGAGDEGGLDRGASSENNVTSLGLDGSAELSRAEELSRNRGAKSASSLSLIVLVSSGGGVDSTRLRFTAGSSSYNEGFRWRE